MAFYTQYYAPSWIADTTTFTVDSIDIIYTADGGAKTDATQVIGLGAAEVPQPDVTGKGYNRPNIVLTTQGRQG